MLNKFIPHRYPLQTSDLTDWMRCVQYFNDDDRQPLWSESVQGSMPFPNRRIHEALFSEAEDYVHFQKAQYMDFNTYLPGDILSKVDIASMMNGLETRTPLLDVRIVEFAAGIPESINITRVNGKWTGKRLLKHTLSSDFGAPFINRSKMGFGVPLKKWLFKGTNLMPEVQERVLDQGAGLDHLFNRGQLVRVLESGNAGHIWLLVFLQEWLNWNRDL